MTVLFTQTKVWRWKWKWKNIHVAGVTQVVAQVVQYSEGSVVCVQICIIKEWTIGLVGGLIFLTYH